MVVAIVGMILGFASSAAARDNDPVWKTPAQLERYIEKNGAWFFDDFPAERIDNADCAGTGPSKRTRNGRAFNRFRCQVSYDGTWELDERTWVFERIWVFEHSSLPGGWGWGVIY
jgi:hypothetical protein